MNYDVWTRNRGCISVSWTIALAERVLTALNIMDPNQGIGPIDPGTQAMRDKHALNEPFPLVRTLFSLETT